MSQVKWNNINFSITQKSLKLLQELGASFKIKKNTDGTTSTTMVDGHELQEFPIEYQASIVAGIDPLTEYQTMLKYLGTSSPLLLQGALYGPDYLMLESVEINTEEISNDGKILSATISLKLKEDNNIKQKPKAAKYVSPLKREYFKNEAKAIEDRVLKIFYNNKDITDSITVNSCIHDMYACSMADTLILKFNDEKKLWDGWKPQKEDIISITCGIAKSGAMFIDSVIPENGLMTLRALSIPPTAKVKSNKSWEDVRLLQLAKEIAQRHNLGFESYGVEDRLYSYVRQDNMPDFEFLQQRCELESLAFLVYDKKLVLYSEEYLENQEPVKTLTVDTDKDFTYTDNALKGLGKIVIKNGDIVGEFISSNGLNRKDERIISTYMSSQDEANRFAKGILRQENKNLATGVWKDAIMREFSAGSILGIKTTGANSWNGNTFISHLRQDYVKSTSKIFFRKAKVS